MAETVLESSRKQESRSYVTVVVGFMIFAQFFGAGNLIFPPFLGFAGGSSWVAGFITGAIGVFITSALVVPPARGAHVL